MPCSCANAQPERVDDAVGDHPGYQAANYRASLTRQMSQVSSVIAFVTDRVVEVAGSRKWGQWRGCSFPR